VGGFLEFEFFESIGLVIESKGVYVDLNARNGRRLLNFNQALAVGHKRQRLSRSKEASMTTADGLRPDAAWCSSHRQETTKSTGLKVGAESQDLRDAEAMVLGPEELVLELDLWNAPKDPPPEHTNALWNYGWVGLV
jgi:hypothetical protein